MSTRSNSRNVHGDPDRRLSDQDWERWVKLIGPHAPCGEWQNTDIVNLLRERQAIETIIMAADVRRSTFLMKEAIEPEVFASTLGDFVEFAKRAVHESGGWFDKFTGDGFLSYWPYMPSDQEESTRNGNSPFFTKASIVVDVARDLLKHFTDIAIPKFRENSQNFPKTTGLAIGLDAGQVSLAMIADDVTIVGPAVVGSVRMVTAASEPGETLANVHLGEFLKRHETQLSNTARCSIKLVYRDTKEYASQEVYSIRFHKSRYS